VVIGLGAMPGIHQSEPPAHTGPADDAAANDAPADDIGLANHGFSYGWPTRGPLAHDAAARAAAQAAVRKAVRPGSAHGSGPTVGSVLWIGPVQGGYGALVRVSYLADTFLSTAFSPGPAGTERWTSSGPSSSDGLAAPGRGTIVALLGRPDAGEPRTLLVLGSPPGFASAFHATTTVVSAEYALTSTVRADGRVHRDWRPLPLRDGVGQVDVPSARLIDLVVRLRLESGATLEATPGNDVTLDPRWNGRFDDQQAGLQVGDKWLRPWAARHGVGQFRSQGVSSTALPDGTAVALSVANVGRYVWAVFSAGSSGAITAEVRLPPATSDRYAGPPEISAYLPTPGACTLMVVVPRGVAQVLLDGAPLALDRGVAVTTPSRCSGGQLTVRATDGRTTYQGPVDTDR
jgi:hypothetical protein